MIADRKTDLFVGGCLFLLGILYLYLRGAFASLPFEDAAILMRYVDHVAQGEGIVWNRGEAPIDGATDFLFVLLAAALQRLGFSTEHAVQVLNISSYVGTVLLIYSTWRRQGLPLSLSISVAVLMLLGPAYAYIEAYFATTFFAFWGTLLAFWGLELIKNPSSKQLACFFGITALLLGLSRPEGVFLSFFIGAVLVFYIGKASSIQLIRYYLIFLVGIGSLYLIWHYIYFGHLLPNPFYKKGGGYLYPASFLQSCSYIFRLLFPLGVLFGVLFKVNSIKQAWFYVLVPVLAFAAIWIFLSDEMNYLMRFQYVLFPITLLNLSFLWKNASQRSWRMRTWNFLLIFLLLFSFAYYLLGFQGNSTHEDGRFTVAQILHTYKDKGYKLALTEAGLLPFYSRWKSLDTWGLNDHKIAIEGVISQAYLAEFDPDIIMYDGFAEEGESLRGSIWNSYGAMIDSLASYIETHDYTLVAKFPDPAGRHAHYYYIKNGSKDADSLSYKIRNCSYYWYEDGSLSAPVYP